MDKNKKICVVIVIAVALVSFYIGTKFPAQSTGTSVTTATDTAQNGTRTGSSRQRNGTGLGGMTSGTILSVSDTGIVLQLRTGGSKIIFVSPGTEVSKFVAGTSADLTTGANVNVAGDANADGSVTAKTIQIRPNTPAGQQVGNGAPTGAPQN